MSTDREARTALAAARHRFGVEFVRHTYFVRTMRLLKKALRNYRMVVLIGPSRVGKGAILDAYVNELNAEVEETSKILAAIVRAESAHRKVFSWKRFWIQCLRAIQDPLPERKVNRASAASGVSRGTGARYRSSSESELADHFRDAARDRGLHILLVDEALALLKNERGRVLRDQLDVLRNLADTEPFRFVLVSTPRILEHFDLSEELDSRMTLVYFPRYTRDDPDEYKQFRQVVRTFMDSLPKRSRFRLTGSQMLELHKATAGCVGHLVHWFRLAVDECLEAEQHQLEWEHFLATFPGDAKVERRWQRCLEGEAMYACASAQTYGEDRVWSRRFEPDLSEFSSEFELTMPEAPSKKPRRRGSTRIGLPGPGRHPVG